MRIIPCHELDGAVLVIDDERRHVIAVKQTEVDLGGDGSLTGGFGNQDATALQAAQPGDGARGVTRLADWTTGPIADIAGAERRVVDESTRIRPSIVRGIGDVHPPSGRIQGAWGALQIPEVEIPAQIVGGGIPRRVPRIRVAL